MVRRVGWHAMMACSVGLLVLAGCGGGGESADLGGGEEIVPDVSVAETAGDVADIGAEEGGNEELPAVDPCEPNPCDEPPADACDAAGLVALHFLAQGVCTADGEEAVCAYEPEEESCIAKNMVCKLGACVSATDPCMPNPCLKPEAVHCKDDAVTLVGYEVPGACTADEEGNPLCDYKEKLKDCSEDGLVCVIDHCGEPIDPCDPNPCTEPPPDECDADGITLHHFPDTGVCTPQGYTPECKYEPTAVDCSADEGGTCEDAMCKSPGFGNNPDQPGDVVVTEIMAKSQPGTDVGEWFELYNPTGEIFDLESCLIKDDGSDLHAIKEHVMVKPGQYVLLARSGEPDKNFGLAPDYVYSGTSLSNSGDAILIECSDKDGNSVVIDHVAFGKSAVVEGIAWQLDPDHLDAADNDVEILWCAATEPYYADETVTKLGTPGAANTDCPEVNPCDPNPCTQPPSVDVCKDDGVTALHYANPGVCTVVDYVAQCDYGPTEEQCDAADKICKDGACVEPPNPCNPNPCTEPPAPACVDGVILNTYPAEGACSVDQGQAKCKYSEIPVDCSKEEKECVVDLCKLPGEGVTPDTVGQFLVTEFLAKAIAGSGDKGEWVELYNATQLPYDLNGCILKDNGTDKFTVPGVFVVKPGQYVVLGKSDVPEENYGAPVKLVTKSFTLGNSGDDIILDCKNVTIDQVTYTTSLVVEGVAAQLRPDMLDHLKNDDVKSWCPATTPFGTAGKLGSPGAVNPPCKSACDPNPCNQPPAAKCAADGKNLLTYPALGACIDNQGTPECTYAESATDCTLSQKVCKDAACVAPPPDPCQPNPCNNPPATKCQDTKVLLSYASPGNCANDNGAAKCTYTEAPTDCSLDGKECKDGACAAIPPPKPDTAGQVIFTELMPKSTGGTDNGEWVEVYNTTDKTFDIGGCSLKDKDTDNHVIAGSLVIGPGATLVLARSKDAVANHGLTFDYVYGTGYSLSNTDDELILVCNAIEIDRVDYLSYWVTEGVAAQLDPKAYDGAKNDSFESWCFAAETYGTAGKKGSPQAKNPACKKVGWCRYQFPTDLKAAPASKATLYGRVFADGITNKTQGPDADATLMAAAGYGPDGTKPLANSQWKWTAAAVNPAWDDVTWNEPGNDEYMVEITAPTGVGSYDLAYRFSLDGGQTWTYCDMAAGLGADGSENGYQPENAGVMTVQ
ncbi:MAG: lamin tail domain-containing protein [Deltaproteobacteria bacterium]|nr:lamin tail domain-containing protein [Deltaproteobacteria bacterium]